MRTNYTYKLDYNNIICLGTLTIDKTAMLPMRGIAIAKD